MKTQSLRLIPVSIDGAINSVPPGRLAVSDYPATTTLDVLDITVGDVLRAAAEDSPHQPALTEGNGSSEPRRWTFSELLNDAEAVARGLLTTFHTGDRVIVWSANMAEWEILEFAMALSGIVLVTANPALTQTELQYIVDQSEAVGIVVGTGNRGKDLMPVASAVVDNSPRVRELIRLQELPRVEPSDPRFSPLPVISPDDIVQIQFTSGTTGRPKGAMLKHRSVANNPRFYSSGTGISARGSLVNPFPLFHTGGCVTGALAPVWLRMNHVLMTHFDPELMLQLLDKERAVAALMVPTMASALLDHPNYTDYDLSHLEYVGAGSAAVPPSLIRRFESEFQCRFSNTFGQTEASPVISQSAPGDTAEDKALSVGRPLVQTHLRIAGPEGNPVPVGEVGEICIRGYQVFAGYLNMPDETGNTIDQNGFLHTGDLGHMDERGYLYIDGRLKDMIVRGGENVYPQEIEYRIADHPAVESVTVVGVKNEYWGETVSAIIVFRSESARPTAAELTAWCREVLNPFKVPTEWYVADSLPLLPSGKIPKFRVADALSTGAYPPLE